MVVASARTRLAIVFVVLPATLLLSVITVVVAIMVTATVTATITATITSVMPVKRVMLLLLLLCSTSAATLALTFLTPYSARVWTAGISVLVAVVGIILPATFPGFVGPAAAAASTTTVSGLVRAIVMLLGGRPTLLPCFSPAAAAIVRVVVAARV